MSFEDTWANASVDQTDDNSPPDGMYDAALVDAGAFTSKQGNDVAKLEFQTVDKQYDWTMILGFGSPKQAGFSKATCMKIGVNVESVSSLDELDEALKAQVGGFFEVTVERNGEYVNTYVNDGATPGDVPPPDPVPATACFGDDDIPFS